MFEDLFSMKITSKCLISWWPLVRDTVAYFIALFFIGMLTFLGGDGSKVGVLPSCILIIYYCLYVMVALFAPRFIDVGYDTHSSSKSTSGVNVSSELEPLLSSNGIHLATAYNGDTATSEEEEVDPPPA